MKPDDTTAPHRLAARTVMMEMPMYLELFDKFHKGIDLVEAAIAAAVEKERQAIISSLLEQEREAYGFPEEQAAIERAIDAIRNRGVT